MTARLQEIVALLLMVACMYGLLWCIAAHQEQVEIRNQIRWEETR